MGFRPCLTAYMLLFAANASAQQPALRMWTPATAIESSSYTDATSAARLASGDISVSPDGNYAFTVRRRGNLDCDCTIDELLVFSGADLENAFAAGLPDAGPRYRFEIRSSSNLRAIRSPRWIRGQAPSLAFIGAMADAKPQVFVWGAGDPAPHQVTFSPTGIESFDLQGGSLVYLAATEETDPNPLMAYPAHLISRDDFRYALGLSADVRYAFYASYLGGPARRVTSSFHPEYNEEAYSISVSPNGVRALIVTPVERPPPEWNRYGAAESSNTIVTRPFLQFSLVDLQQVAIRPLFNAPTGIAVRNIWPLPFSIWDDDSRHAIIANTAVPLRNGPRIANAAYVIDFDVMTMRYNTVLRLDSSLPVTALRRTDDGRGLVVTQRRIGEAGYQTSVMTRRGNRWSSGEITGGTFAQSPGTLSNGIRVSVHQDANTPPLLLASRESLQLRLSQPDATVADVARSPVEPFTWRDPDGRTWTGGLVRAASSSGAAAPLVIQTYYYEPEAFLPEGTLNTAFAAQSLASRGISVLQVNMTDMDDAPINRQPQTFVASVDAAVDLLVSEGSTDRERIGIIGFSASGWLTIYALTHPGRTRFAAAIDANGGNHSYVEYLTLSVLSPSAAPVISQFENEHGGPFWHNRENWLANAPGFNLHSVETPLLMVLSGYGIPQHLLGALEVYAGLRLNAKPVDLLILPFAEHDVVRPRERLASMNATVDWMAFWLQGEEANLSGLPEQYARWREMKDQRHGQTSSR